MKMTSKKLKDMLIERLEETNRSFVYNAKEETLRIENTMTKKGITISLSPLVAKAEVSKEAVIDETVYYVNEALQVMGSDHSLNQQEANIYPVIRSTSFPTSNQDGETFMTEEHTAETRIYYALDLGTTYRLLDINFIEQNGWKPEMVKHSAASNLAKLYTSAKSESVAGNVFYFVSTKDGYDASKILNTQWLEKMRTSITGEMAVAVPHGDVCIIADIRNNTGYDILAQMSMSFFTSGHVPITALSFLYNDGELEPIFILGKNKPNE
ncbi:DUF1444 domain-containing protein [Bacillus massiliigorillae]|uniref:DUF1444 domain-containing protein n=1 Tax=Bacillus massiliigorillae TaxID=1243664 RepID=UPI0009DF1A2A|nr:DUF1444 domain-containing protein [Bacillus massiliigorillae]